MAKKPNKPESQIFKALAWMVLFAVMIGAIVYERGYNLDNPDPASVSPWNTKNPYQYKSGRD